MLKFKPKSCVFFSLEFALEKIFSDTGTFGFLDKVQKVAGQVIKQLNDVLVLVFELHAKVVSEYSYHLEPYVDGLLKRSLAYAGLQLTASKLKQTAYQVVIGLLQFEINTGKELLKTEAIQTVARELLETFNTRATEGSRVACLKLTLLGLISRRFPAVMVPYERLFRQKVYEVLQVRLDQQQYLTGAMEFIIGAFDGLCSHLMTFQISDDEAGFVESLYRYIKALAGTLAQVGHGKSYAFSNSRIKF